jgi:hypothetical protein
MSPQPVHRRNALLSALALIVTAVTVLATASLAAATPPVTATRITVTSAFTDGIDVPATPGKGSSYVVQDMSFTVGFTTDAPLSTTKSTRVLLTVTSGPDTGSFTIGYDVPANATSGSISGAVLATPANNVGLKVAVDDKNTDVVPGTITVDVLKSSATVPGSSALTGFGGGGGAGVACHPTSADPTCGDLLLPESNGVLSNELLSTGSCAGVCTRTAASVLQALVAVDPGVYNKSNPIEIVAKCDKTVCPGKGIKSYSVKVQLTPGSAPVVSPACLSKGVIAASQDFCTDYVQSNRDGAGDVLLYVELPFDAKIIW